VGSELPGGGEKGKRWVTGMRELCAEGGVRSEGGELAFNQLRLNGVMRELLPATGAEAWEAGKELEISQTK